ncbi:MAG: signal peptidase I [Mollicutes bacterium]|nr:signal peptidase I [Mollicutes bacterium]
MKDKLKEIRPYIIIFLTVILVRTFFYTPIRVNGASMEPTLIDKEIMVLDKISPKISGLKRFEIIVLKTGNSYLIKRIIGLPGETIKYEDNKLFINGKIIKDPYTNNFETDYPEKKIPKDEYFVLGDNRGYSKDSRMIGTISKKEIIGKTSIIIFPFNKIGIAK